jgi:hypothetical protein
LDDKTQAESNIKDQRPKANKVMQRKLSTTLTLLPARRFIALQLFALLLALTCSTAQAQGKRQKLPSPDRIVNDYLKAIGGKKRVAGVRDATYEWTVRESKPPAEQVGRAVLQVKAPSSTRFELSIERAAEASSTGTTQPVNVAAVKADQFKAGANARSAWLLDSESGLRTLTDAQAHAAKLQAALDASHLVDYKKLNVLARTAAIEEKNGEQAYLVEFSLRNGARLRYWFSVSSKLLLATGNAAQQVTRSFRDYREENGVLEPHRIDWQTGTDGLLTLELQRVSYNTSLSDALFDPPTSETIDIGALLREIDRNQEQIDERVGDYTYTEKLTERKINDKGEVTEESVKVFEVYPIPGREDVRKLVSENGVLLSAEKAAKEDKRVIEEMEKAERERAKEAEKRERERAKGKKPKEADDDPGIGDFLRSAELVSPRRERLRERDTIVFDFRPRAGYKPKTTIESMVSKLTGVVWIDPVDKQVMRLEARLVESYKMGGGLVANIRPGTAFVFEQRRMEDGVWLPVYTQANISAKIFLFKGLNLNITQEFSNYQHFNGNVNDYKLTAPGEKDKPPSGPPD